MASSTSSITLGSSSIDVASLVSNLVAAKRADKDKQLSDAVTANTTQISAIGNFTSSLTSLQAAIKSLSTSTAFTTQKTSVGDSTILGVTADADATPNNYDIVVSKLATAQKTTSPAFTSSTAAVGTGTLNIAIGDKSMSIDVASGANTLQNIRDQINKSADNPGVTASIVTGADGAHLVLTSTATGSANAFTVTTSGGDGGLAGLNFDPSTGTPTTVAQDAEYTVDGTKVTSASNTDATAIDGVTLTLTKTGESTVSIANDTSVVTTAVQNLVTAYNSFVSTYQSLTKYDSTNNEVGALIGDATVTSIKSQITSLLGSQSTAAGAGPKSLSDLGVSFQTDGTLAFDSTKLTKVMATNPKETQALVGGSTGIAGKLDTLITNWTSSSGILTQRTNNLNDKAKDLTQQQTDYDTQMTAYTARLTTQYTALDTLMTKLQSTSSYLTQQFDALTNKS
ncbi:flagellar filament capping protein FliD [Luteibacter aegosomaticola]|jgi:flagellar hook-associated protein 2|uniref:flagellar filament capping protein FliD n=1 Tax=Luteibacter aegosomaticola TaxID=2911538 RepID=UPI001FF9BB96|nr:flagellar filament capping protein FliD [Luteibacter aegosomaticola]UPG89019.1 flagellar filament capping protein FliD [Luteibacter aegosomaticola]